MCNEKMEREGRMVNLYLELLRGVQIIDFGVRLNLKAENQNTLIEQSTTLIEHPSFQEVVIVFS